MKLDPKRDLRHLYFPSAKEAAVVTVPPLNFLMADGEGDPNAGPRFQAAIDALYGVAYTLKFMVKKRQPQADYTVMPLEGLWWTEGAAAFSPENKDLWQWTLMIAQPGFIAGDLFQEAVEQVRKRKDPPALSGVRLETFDEGLCAQIMHVGPYAGEKPTIEKLHAFIRESGYRPRGKHHEIYLSDPRRAKPERLKTVIRQPVAPAGSGA